MVEDRVVDNTAPTKPGGFKGTVSGSTFSLSWKPASDNSARSPRTDLRRRRARYDGRRLLLSAPMGAFRLTDTRAFQVAAVDGAGNVGALSSTLKVVPKLTKLTVAAAKKALTKRGLKAGKITYKTSAKRPEGQGHRRYGEGPEARRRQDRPDRLPRLDRPL